VVTNCGLAMEFIQTNHYQYQVSPSDVNTACIQPHINCTHVITSDDVRVSKRLRPGTIDL